MAHGLQITCLASLGNNPVIETIKLELTSFSKFLEQLYIYTAIVASLPTTWMLDSICTSQRKFSSNKSEFVQSTKGWGVSESSLD